MTVAWVAADPRVRRTTSSPVPLVLLATPVVVLVNAPVPELQVMAAALTLVVWSSTSRLLSPYPWLVTGAVALVWDAANWHGLDDHVPLTHYWLVGIGTSLFASDRARALERNAMLLIGLAFALALLSKIAWGDVLSGDFYRAIALLDDRMIWLAELAGVDDAEANQALADDVHRRREVTVDIGERAGAVSAAMTVGTFVVEGLVAASFLLPLRGTLRWIRTGSLAVFCVLTYAIVPVAGFGSLLLVLASAERRLTDRQRLLHYAGVVALFAWVVTWGRLHG